jgi:isopenicillin N synthase-like dioxygenase
MLIRVIGDGLGLTDSEKQLLTKLHSGHNNQLRLLHYPPVPAEALEKQVVARMPAHSDWR